jgi:hypothetical protein
MTSSFVFLQMIISKIAFNFGSYHEVWLLFDRLSKWLEIFYINFSCSASLSSRWYFQTLIDLRTILVLNVSRSTSHLIEKYGDFIKSVLILFHLFDLSFR